LWDMIIDSAINKKKVNNTHNFQILHHTMTKMNKNEEFPLGLRTDFWEFKRI